MMFFSVLAASVAIAVDAAPGVLELNSTEFEFRYAQWEKLYAKASGRNTAAGCSNDMRSSMPACQQKGDMWCWATGVAELQQHYTGGGGCDHQCDVVGWCPDCVLGPDDQCDPYTGGCTGEHIDCCPYSAHVDRCGHVGATFAMLTEAANHFTGKVHSYYNGPMPQATLDQTLAAGHPVIMVIGEKGGIGSHVTTVGGCGGGNYYYHDPETSEYDEVSYANLLKPWNVWNESYVWIDTFYTSGESAETVV